MKKINTVDEFINTKFDNVLQEGLIRTVNSKDAVARLLHNMGGHPAKPSEAKNGRILFAFGSKLTKKNGKTTEFLTISTLDWVIHLCNNLGYYPSQFLTFSDLVSYKKYDDNEVKELIKNDTGEVVDIVFSPKFSPSVLSSEVPDILYHVSDGSVKDKILRIGLSPKTTNKIESHPDRIYFCKTTECIKTLLRNSKFYKNNSTSDTVCLFEISSDKIKDDVDFYVDPSHKDALYTYGNIRPVYLKLIQEVTKPTK